MVSSNSAILPEISNKFYLNMILNVENGLELWIIIAVH